MLSFGTDAGGIGTALAGIFQATSKGTEDCGSRPVCIGNLGNCEQKQIAFNQCVSKSMDLKSKTTINSQITRMIMVVLILVVILIGIYIVVNKQNK